MRRGEGRTHQTSQMHGSPTHASAPPPPKKAASERLKTLWPDIWVLVKPRRKLLAVGLLLIVINRVSGLVLPASTRYLIDNVIGKHQASLLLPLVLSVVAATAI